MRIILPLIIVVYLLNACKTENNDINIGDNTNSLSSNSIDTFSLQSYSFEVTDLPSNQSSEVFLGTYSSTELGSITNTVYTTIAPTDLSFRIPDEGLNAVNSTLTFTIKSAYGTPFSQSFEVKQLSEKIKTDTDYYTSDSLATNSVTIGQFQIVDNSQTEVTVSIDNSVAEYILAQGNVAFTTAEVFSDLFNGLAIIPTSTASANSGSVYAVDASDIKLTVNYTGKTTGTNYSLIFQPTAATRTAYYCKKERSNSAVSPSLNNTELGSKTFFLQGISAVSARIIIPGIKNWYTSDNHIINKATFTLSPNLPANSTFTLPTTLTCHVKGSATSEGTQATYDATAKSYIFEIASLISNALLTEEEVSFNISVLNSNVHPEQVSISGFEDATQPASLKIFYTKY